MSNKTFTIALFLLVLALIFSKREYFMNQYRFGTDETHPVYDGRVTDPLREL